MNVKEKIKKIYSNAESASNSALSAVRKYISLFRPDIFGKQKQGNNAEENFFAMAEELKHASEIFFECAEECLLLENDTEDQELHKKAVLLSEINDLCIEPFLKEVYEEALKPTVDVGKIKRSADTLSVKLKNYMTRIF